MNKKTFQAKINPRMFQSEPLRRCALKECKAACCLHGVWVDKAEVNDILNHQALIAPHMPVDLKDPAQWFDGRQEDDVHTLSGVVEHTTVLPASDHYGGTACIFLRSDHKCALQVAAEVNGLHPWRFKPFYCILHPLDFDEQGRITLDETDNLLAEPASCVRKATQSVPLVETFGEELNYLFGKDNLRKLIQETKE